MNNEILIIGKPNSGKSTLFNRLLRKKIAITYGMKGTTRDLIRHEFNIGDNTYTLIDSGGIGESSDNLYQDMIRLNIFEKLESVSLIIMLVSVMDYTDEDSELVNKMRKYYNKLLLVVNKVDNDKLEQAAMNFLTLGLETMFVSAEHGIGIENLIAKIDNFFDDIRKNNDDKNKDEQIEIKNGYGISILGEPNSGKSSLLNTLTKENIAMVSPIPNTTRDTLSASFIMNDKKYTIYDTAGIRRKTKVKEDVEYYSVMRAIDSIKHSHVVILLIDAQRDLTRQDKRIAKLVLDRHRPIIIAFNKMDLLERTKSTEESIVERTRYTFPILSYVPIVFLSTYTGYGISNLIKKCDLVYNQSHARVSTSKLNQKIRGWIAESPPTAFKGRKRLRVKYITQVSIAPPKFVIFVNNKEYFNESYQRFLKNNIQKELGFNCVPIILEIRDTSNHSDKESQDEQRSAGHEMRRDEYVADRDFSLKSGNFGKKEVVMEYDNSDVDFDEFDDENNENFGKEFYDQLDDIDDEFDNYENSDDDFDKDDEDNNNK